MLGRQVGSGLLRLPIYARLPIRTTPFQCQHGLPSRALIVSSQRFYATPGRPRKAVGEPSRPVKRAVKRAAKSTTTEDAATKQVRAKKKTAAAKKPATKKKTVAAKKPVKKKVAKKVPKKALTEEQKVAAQAKKETAALRNLKKAALSPPPRPAMSAYSTFVQDKSKGSKVSATASLRSVVQEWKSLAPAELEHYNHLAHQASETRQAAYKRWVESHTAEAIKLANSSRAQLRRKLDLKKGSRKYLPIKDERAVKRPASSFIQFGVSRHASGDFKNIALGDRSKLISQEWKALDESEKKKYKDLHMQDRSRYTTEHKDVYGSMPASMNGISPQLAAAAA